MRWLVGAIIILLLGCVQDTVDGPKVSFKLDTGKITVSADTLSEDFITATVIRKDDGAEAQVFELRFLDELESVYATTVDGNRQIVLATRPLKGRNAQDTVQFKVYGSKGDAFEARYKLGVELWWNGSKLEGQTLDVLVE